MNQKDAGLLNSVFHTLLLTTPYGPVMASFSKTTSETPRAEIRLEHCTHLPTPSRVIQKGSCRVTEYLCYTGTSSECRSDTWPCPPLDQFRTTFSSTFLEGIEPSVFLKLLSCQASLSTTWLAYSSTEMNDAFIFAPRAHTFVNAFAPPSRRDAQRSPSGIFKVSR